MRINEVFEYTTYVYRTREGSTSLGPFRMLGGGDSGLTSPPFVVTVL